MICAVICCVKDKLLKFWEATIMPLVLPIKKWKYFLLFLICSSVSVMAFVRSKIVCVLSFVFWCVWEARLVIVLLFWPKSSMYTGVCHGGMYFLESCSYLVSQQQKRAFESFVWEWENVAYFLSILYCSHLHCVLIKNNLKKHTEAMRTCCISVWCHFHQPHYQWRWWTECLSFTFIAVACYVCERQLLRVMRDVSLWDEILSECAHEYSIGNKECVQSSIENGKD